MKGLFNRKTMKTVLFWTSIIILALGVICYLISCFNIPYVNNDKLESASIFLVILSRFTDMFEKEFKLESKEEK